ncbi:hypothetical protein [Desulfothermobacter acidiphilus]|uniref:hypothetical protein n=1 Tax=Desulfothermobacter acidiphilus TaxID=1938353 RepID=UPI003F893D60
MKALIDVGDWQELLTLEEGRALEGEEAPELVRDLAARYPYPGDLDPASATWVTEMALALERDYAPELLVAIYASPYWAAFHPEGKGAWEERVVRTRGEVERLLSSTSLEPVLVGLGGMLPCRGEVELLSSLEGLAVAAGPLARQAGLFLPTSEDLELLRRAVGIERVVAREEFQNEFGGHPAFYQRFPDHLILAQEGFCLRALGSSPRPAYLAPEGPAFIPLTGPAELGERINSLVDLAPTLLELLRRGQRILLVLLEGMGTDAFPWPFRPVANTCGWYRYITADFPQYLALFTGQHFTAWTYPPGLAYYREDRPGKPYPFSGLFSELPAAALGRIYPGRTAAVGGRSVHTHVFTGCRLCVECFVRGLYHQGVMVTWRDPL